MLRSPRLEPSSSLRLQVLQEAHSVMAPEAGSFDDVVWDASCVAEEVIREDDSLAMLNLLVASMEDISLVAEEQEGLTPSELDAPPKLTPPAPAPTQTMPGSGCSTLIIFDDGKLLLSAKRTHVIREAFY